MNSVFLPQLDSHSAIKAAGVESVTKARRDIVKTALFRDNVYITDSMLNNSSIVRTLFQQALRSPSLDDYLDYDYETCDLHRLFEYGLIICALRSSLSINNKAMYTLRKNQEANQSTDLPTREYVDAIDGLLTLENTRTYEVTQVADMFWKNLTSDKNVQEAYSLKKMMGYHKFMICL